MMNDLFGKLVLWGAIIIFLVGAFALVGTFVSMAFQQTDLIYSKNSIDVNGTTVVLVDSYHCQPIYTDGPDYTFQCKPEELWWKER